MLAIQTISRWVENQVSTPDNARIFLNDAQFVLVFPVVKKYFSNVSDWSAFRTSVDFSFEEQKMSQSQPSDFPNTQPLDNLRWKLAYEESKAVLDEKNYPYALARVQLKNWPNITRLPDGFTPELARICALLAKKSVTTSLIPSILGIHKLYVFRIIETLRLLGHVEVLSNPISVSDSQQDTEFSLTSTEFTKFNQVKKALPVQKLVQKISNYFTLHFNS